MNTIIKDSLAKSVSYQTYRKKVSDLLNEGKSTGPNQTVSSVRVVFLSKRFILASFKLL